MKIKLLMLFFVLHICNSNIFSADSRRDFLIYYDNPNWPGDAGYSQIFSDSFNLWQRELIVSRYEFGIGQKVPAQDVLFTLNPSFGWLRYNSFQDNYINGEEHNWLVNRAIKDNQNPDILYLHYFDDTEIQLDGTTVTIKGWGGGSATSIEESRLPVYYSNKSRIMCNYSNSYSRQYYKEYTVYLLENPGTDQYGTSTHYLTGIFWDNCQPPLYNTGRIISGGHVLEHPSHARIDSLGSRYLNWWFTDNMKPFMQSLMDTFALSSEWMPNNNDKLYNMLNTAGSTLSSLATDSLCTHLFQEFSPSITRALDNTVDLFSNFDILCLQNGVSLTYSPSSSTTVTDGLGTYSKSEVLHGNLCFFYITSTDSSYFYQQSTNGPGSFGWDTLVWCGSMDFDMGRPNGSHFIISSGSDPKNNTYKIYRRNYENAIVLLRPRGSYDQDIDELTSVKIELGGSYRELYPDGTFGTTTTTTTLRNAQGKIFVFGKDTIPPDPIIDLGCSPGTNNGSIKLTWTSSGDDDSTGTATLYEVKSSTTLINVLNYDSIATSSSKPPRPLPSGSSQTMTLTNLTPGINHYIAMKVFDEVGNPSVISNVVNCESAIDITTNENDSTQYIPSLLSPFTGSLIFTLQPTLSVQNITTTGTNNYFFELATDALFTEIIKSSMAVSEGNNTTNWQVDTQLEIAQVYYWRVKVNNYLYSNISSFTIKTPSLSMSNSVIAYPNPISFVNGELIAFSSLPNSSVELTIQTISGETVLHKVGILDSWTWDGTNTTGSKVAIGTYLWYLNINRQIFSGKIVNK